MKLLLVELFVVIISCSNLQNVMVMRLDGSNTGRNSETPYTSKANTSAILCKDKCVPKNSSESSMQSDCESDLQAVGGGSSTAAYPRGMGRR